MNFWGSFLCIFCVVSLPGKMVEMAVHYNNLTVTDVINDFWYHISALRENNTNRIVSIKQKHEPI